MAIVVRNFKYKVRCDFRGCMNMASYSIGDERAPQQLMLNICPDCMQQIVNAAPKSVILNRYDIKNITKDLYEPTLEKEIPFKLPVDFENLPMNTLRVMAKKFGISLPIGMTKVEAVQTLYNLQNNSQPAKIINE